MGRLDIDVPQTRNLRDRRDYASVRLGLLGAAIRLIRWRARSQQASSRQDGDSAISSVRRKYLADGTGLCSSGRCAQGARCIVRLIQPEAQRAQFC